MKSISTIIATLAVLTIMATSIHFLCKKVNELKIENKRVSQNIQNLTAGIKHYRTADSLKAARIGVLTLRASELEQYNSNLTKGLRAMGVRIKDVERISTQGIESAYRIVEMLRDSIKYLTNKDTGLADTVIIKYARYEDRWLSFYQEQIGNKIETQIKTRDSITIVQHWEPYKFLFFRWGKKNNHETIVNHNPHSEVKFALSIKIDRR